MAGGIPHSKDFVGKSFQGNVKSVPRQLHLVGFQRKRTVSAAVERHSKCFCFLFLFCFCFLFFCFVCGCVFRNMSPDLAGKVTCPSRKGHLPQQERHTSGDQFVWFRRKCSVSAAAKSYSKCFFVFLFFCFLFFVLFLFFCFVCGCVFVTCQLAQQESLPAQAEKVTYLSRKDTHLSINLWVVVSFCCKKKRKEKRTIKQKNKLQNIILPYRQIPSRLPLINLWAVSAVSGFSTYCKVGIAINSSMHVCLIFATNNNQIYFFIRTSVLFYFFIFIFLFLFL